jgi:hypothetical protein
MRDPSYASLWNAGYDLYRLYPRNQDTALAIHRGYMAVRGNTPEARRAIRQAAVYWEKVYYYGVINVPVGQDFTDRGHTSYNDYGLMGDLAMRRPKNGVPSLKSDKAMGRKKQPPSKGRPSNPYPGPYYPGIYPP